MIRLERVGSNLQIRCRQSGDAIAQSGGHAAAVDFLKGYLVGRGDFGSDELFQALGEFDFVWSNGGGVSQMRHPCSSSCHHIAREAHCTKNRLFLEGRTMSTSTPRS